ncbi:NAD(P)H-binding protein [Sphingobacterium psychroaquaticum]|uniref:NAD(P)H-binding n=1 Tax=Sphingobacterium psychroaquaticum TaxID=561061 RepID=A0A1X7II97_9SPHI|nr:NAD(P)H-binding protein [Sphingobacterium psychroaquaticum]SMG14304.1 NAD(P)H-binding [Sphingobacterium psychroaquaticum]
MKAVVLGATGATGKALIQALLADERFDTVIALTRRPFFAPHAKLKEVIVDFTSPDIFNDAFQEADIAYSCMGTTLKDAGSKEAHWRVDYDYQLNFAAYCRNIGVSCFVLLSAIGSKATSPFFYSRMKGELDHMVRGLGFPKLRIVQPAAILRPESTRAVEVFMGKASAAFSKIGLFRDYAPISTTDLAKVLIHISLVESPGVLIWKRKDFIF